jgi:hypothetical protein
MSQLYPYSRLNFTCDNCSEEFRNKTAYSPIKNARQYDQFITYCSDCVKEEPEITCSFIDSEHKPIITCDKSLFNKKKLSVVRIIAKFVKDLMNLLRICQLVALLLGKEVETVPEIDSIFETWLRKKSKWQKIS